MTNTKLNCLTNIVAIMLVIALTSSMAIFGMGGSQVELALQSARYDSRLTRDDIKQLIQTAKDQNIDINNSGTDTDGFNLLHYAVLNGRLIFVEELLAAGADPLAKTQKGDTPLSIAKTLHRYAKPDKMKIAADIYTLLQTTAQKQSSEGSNASSAVEPQTSSSSSSSSSSISNNSPKPAIKDRILHLVAHRYFWITVVCSLLGYKIISRYRSKTIHQTDTQQDTSTLDETSPTHEALQEHITV
jgi:hypothetical protein